MRLMELVKADGAIAQTLNDTQSFAVLWKTGKTRFLRILTRTPRLRPKLRRRCEIGATDEP